MNIKDVLKDNAKKVNNNYDGELEVADDWGEDDWGMDGDDEDIESVDYKKANLNKLSDAQLAKHKQLMDKDFSVNQLKPGDPGFVYDKRVEFGRDGNDSPLEDDSWGEEEDEEVVAKGNAV